MAKESMFDNPQLLVFIPLASHDQMLVRTYLERNAPQVLADDRMIETADVASFNPQQVITCMFRNPRLPARDRARDAEGNIIEVMRPISELLSELVIGKPVNVADFWLKPKGMRAGNVDFGKLLSAINATCSPYRLYWRDMAAPKPSKLGLVMV